MTYPQYPPNFQPPRPPTPSGSSAKPLIIAAAVIGGLCTIGIIIGMVGAVADSTSKASGAKPSTALAASSPLRPTTSAAPTVVYDIPTHENVAPEVTVTEKKCYGSLGCNFKYELRIVTTTPVTFAPTQRYRVTVALDEGTDWERVHSVTITGTKADVITGRVSSDLSTAPVATIQSITPL